MAKVKVHELAKEIGVSSKDVLSFLNTIGVEAKAAQSSIEDSEAEMVKKTVWQSTDGSRRSTEG